MRTETKVVLFDVNETLSDMAPMADRFAEVGSPGLLAKVWFAGVLRDGFALAATGGSDTFAAIATELLRGVLTGLPLTRDIDDAVEHVMNGFADLDVHPDVTSGIRALAGNGFRLATLTNGSTQVAETLFSKAGIRDEFETLLSVEDAPGWKPLRGAYEYGAESLGVEPVEILLVAVHPWDIHGAAAAGMRTAWLNRAGGNYPAHFTAPDITVQALDELAPLLRDAANGQSTTPGG